MRFPALLATILLFTTPALAADWEGIYKGTLGKAKVLVQLVEPLDDMEGETKRETSRYSYLPRVRDLNLILTQNGKVLEFEETPIPYSEFMGATGDDRKVTGRWAVSVKGEKVTGTWTSPDGKKKLPIALTHVPDLSEDEADPDLNIWSATYNAEWLKSVTFSDAGTAKSFGKVEVRWMKDSAFGIEFPVLGTFPDAARKEAANAMLMDFHRASISNYRDCKNGVPVQWEDANAVAEYSYSVEYASPTLLSVSEHGSVFCGGAYPDNYKRPRTYDLTDASQIGGENELDLSRDGFGHLLKLATKDERIAFEKHALGLYRAGAAADKEMGQECATGWIDDAPDGAKNFTLYFTEKGLAVFREDYPHMLAVCLGTDFNPTIIPWADLKPWLKPGQKLLTTELSP